MAEFETLMGALRDISNKLERLDGKISALSSQITAIEMKQDEMTVVLNGQNSHAKQTKTENEGLMTSPEVRRMFGNITEMTIWRWVRSEGVKFPKPIRIATRNYWRRGDVLRWREAQAATAK